MTSNTHEHHGHGHHHSDQTSFSEVNRAHWDQKAATYMSDNFQKEFGDLINKVTAFIHSNITWISEDFLDPATTSEKTSDDEKSKRTVRVLDYACGPGTITAALVGYASEFIGIDFSTKMVEEYNKNSSAKSTDSHTTNKINAKAYVGNLLSADDPSPTEFSGEEFTNFDLVAVGLGFHHFEHLEEVTKRLTNRVRPGGTLMIVDFLPHAKNDLGEDTAHVIAHHGFTEDKVKALFTGAGLTEVELRVMHEPVMLRGKAPRTPFIARGRKPN